MMPIYSDFNLEAVVATVDTDRLHVPGYGAIHIRGRPTGGVSLVIVLLF